MLNMCNTMCKSEKYANTKDTNIENNMLVSSSKHIGRCHL